MPYTVTRQLQWPDGTKMVEISAGSLDYTNPDALSAKYPGEFETYDDPQEAVETAIAICTAWRRDGAPDAAVGYGANGGMTMPFEACTFQEARAWAQERAESLPRCDRCGVILSNPRHYTVLELDDQKFCSEFCAEVAYWGTQDPEE